MPNRRGIYPGVFGLVNALAKQGRLSDAEEAFRRENNAWYEANFTDPATVDPTVYDRAVNPEAAAWFKASAGHLIRRVPDTWPSSPRTAWSAYASNRRTRAGSSTRTRIKWSSSHARADRRPPAHGDRQAPGQGDWLEASVEDCVVAGIRSPKGNVCVPLCPA
ncbi:hypothetical protein ACI2LC_01090 [Nonomuraea wenchangensis]|uniref:hypothetical protein n=1 Tax=Nonomuraea wenchangensis TaxID=568860 RepID=UPI00384F089F